MRQRVSTGSLILGIVTAGIAGQAAGQSGEIDEPFITETSEHIDRLEKFGMASVFVLWQDGEWKIEQSSGLADRESNLAWSPEVVSTIGSITKQFTGAAILKLQEQGKLSVEDSITAYFTDVPEDKRGITLHHLLTHSSGIQDIPDAGDHTPIDRDEFVRRAMIEPLKFEPGSRYQYSNAGYSLLGAIMELVTATSYEQWVRDELFLPLGMMDTGYLLPKFDAARMAKGYEGDKLWGTVLERPMADDGPYWVLRANGGIHSTARDMVRWGQALIDGEVLSASSMSQYWAPHVDESNGGGRSFYGYGWSNLTLPNGQRLITHDGGNGILGASMMILPDLRTIMFVQTNVISENRSAMQLLEQVTMHLVAGESYPSLPDITPLSAEQRESFAGVYRIEEGQEITIKIVDDSWITAATTAEAYTALFPTDLSISELRVMNKQLKKAMTSWIAGDFSVLYKMYNVDEPEDQWTARHRAKIEDAEKSSGPLRRFEVVGSGNSGLDGYIAGTLVRVHFERETLDRVYVWEAPNDMAGYMESPTFWPARLVHGGDGTFSSNDPAARSRPTAGQLVLTTSSDGSVVLTLPNGQVAKKIAAH